MIEQLFDKIQGLKRPETLKSTRGGNYTEKEITLVYNDGTKKYEEPAGTKYTYAVTSASALVDFIKEECNRRDNKIGNKSTLQLNSTGGLFIADTDYKYGVCEYNRKFSQQWEVLQKYANQTLSHKEFMRALKKLKPSIDEFDAVFQAYAQIRLIGNSKLISNPIFTNNQAESGYMCKYTIEGSEKDEQETTLPAGFTISLPYGKGTEDLYDVDIELLFSRNEYDELEIEFGVPELDNIEEQAIKDEAQYIRDNTEDLAELLILADF